MYFNVSKEPAPSNFKAEVYFKLAAVSYPTRLLTRTILHGVMKS